MVLAGVECPAIEAAISQMAITHAGVSSNDDAAASSCATRSRFRLHAREHRGSTKTGNRHVAQRIAGARYNEALDGKPSRRRSTLTLSTLIRAFLAHVAMHRTANKAERVLKQFQTCIGDRRIINISVFQIEKWKLARSTDVALSTVTVN